MAHPRSTRLDHATLNRYAVASDTCLKSWVKVCSGTDPVLNVVRGLAGHRIRNYLHANGLEHLAPQMFREQLGSVASHPGVAEDPEETEAEKTSIAV